MKIAVAQSSSIKGDISLNINNHLRYIRQAGKLGVNYLVFPELSLSGYEPELAKALAFEADDTRLMPLIEAAKEYRVSVAVGAPLLSDGLPKIGLLVIHDSGKVDTYAKMYLHDGEGAYFSKGDQAHLFNIGQENIANAICADTNNPAHAKICAQAGASVYIAGVLVTPGGYAGDAENWSAYAAEHNMLVAIANYNKASGGFPAAGKSAIWYKNTLLAQAGTTQDALVLAEKQGGVWLGKVYEIS